MLTVGLRYGDLSDAARGGPLITLGTGGSCLVFRLLELVVVEEAFNHGATD